MNEAMGEALATDREGLAEVAYRAWCEARRGGEMDPAEYEAIRSRVEFEWAHNVVDAVLAALSTQPAAGEVEWEYGALTPDEDDMEVISSGTADEVPTLYPPEQIYRRLPAGPWIEVQP